MTDKTKTVLASMWVVLLILLLLTFSIYRDIHALSRDTQARAAAAQQRWAERRIEDQKQDQALHDDIVGQLTQLTGELRAQRLAIRRLNGVTPVEAMRDRAAASP